MKNPARVAAGRKGGKAAYRGKKGFAADKTRASIAGKKGGIARWLKPKTPTTTKPTALSKYKLEYEASPNEPAVKRKRKAKK